MNAFKTLVASAVLAVAAPTFAGTVTAQLDFETVGNFAGLSQAGNNPYAGSGLTFSGNAYGIRSRRDGGGSGSFFRDPANKGALMMFDDAAPGEAAITINVASGFSDFFSVDYTGTSAAVGRAEVYDVDGKLLQTEAFDPLSGSCPTSTDYLCEWKSTSFDFTGVAYSIKLFGASTLFFFDDIKLGRADPGQVPEPSSFALGLAAFAALGLSRRRKTQG